MASRSCLMVGKRTGPVYLCPTRDHAVQDEPVRGGETPGVFSGATAEPIRRALAPSWSLPLPCVALLLLPLCPVRPSYFLTTGPAAALK